MRILVVEDTKKIADSLKKGLKQEGFAVDVAYSGDEGYDLASSEPYDILILDIMLPGMNGLEICSALRQKGNKTPVLMLTAKSELENKVEGLNIGADDYLTKPFEFSELVARIKALLRRPKEIVNNVITVDDLELNSTDYTVNRSKKLIHLSKKEFALLEMLMRNKNTTLSKDKLLEHVWPFDSDVLPNTVEVYIGYLRNKIEKPFKKSPKLIKTVRGFGYVIKDV